jgi:hypothetical protein
MARGETDTALNILRTVGAEQPYYIQANIHEIQTILC